MNTGAWVAATMLVFVPTAAQAITSPTINEFVINHIGFDANQFVELRAQPSTDYSTLTIVEIEGDTGFTGLIDDATMAVGTTNSDGYWCSEFLADVIEGGTVTLLLVDGFNGNVGDDIDVDDDGVIDNPRWTTILDGISVTKGAASDHTYAEVTLTASFDGGGSVVGGASRIPDGMDTDTSLDWVRNDFNGAGLPCCDDSGLQDTEAVNTPCAANRLGLEVPVLRGSFSRLKARFED
jgi:hypothetical protein